MEESVKKRNPFKQTFLILMVGMIVVIAVFICVRMVVSDRENVDGDRIVAYEVPEKGLWKIQSIDTMKQSRDLARGKLHDSAYDIDIDWQVRAIAETGANYIAIDTPYDKEFIPFLQRWVTVARKYDLNVWFRGNWSGWEGWFDYPKNLSREKHIQKTEDFILDNPDMFRDGDIFSPCPECENGGPGDPRQTGDTDGYRKFIIDEYQTQMAAFSQINRKVQVFYPSNRDVAKLIMDKETTRALGGFVVIDHYINDPKKMANDIENIAQSSGGRVVLGEFGSPPLGANEREMTEEGQVQWIRTVLDELSHVSQLEGVNYWINTGGPTELWKENRIARPAVSTLKDYFMPDIVYGVVTDDSLCPIANAKVMYRNKETLTKNNGYFKLRSIGEKVSEITFSAPDFFERKERVNSSNNQLDIILKRKEERSIFHKKWFFATCFR